MLSSGLHIVLFTPDADTPSAASVFASVVVRKSRWCGSERLWMPFLVPFPLSLL